MEFTFNNTFAQLPGYFHSRTQATPVKDPKLIIFNHELAEQLGASGDLTDDNKLAQIFSGNLTPTGAEPLATVYAGHQFGGFSPQLGDGRALLLGETVTDNGERFDIQLKGAGPTPYSRNGDGRSALGPVLREYLVSEAMAKLGIPTTRALAAVTTGEQVARERLVAGGIITRVAKGFVRVGSFEYFSSQQNTQAIKELADYEIKRHYSQNQSAQDLESASPDNPYVAFLEAVIDKQAKLIAQWMNIGFIHGVMNTDNMAISGETIDYGPCAFMDEFSFDRVYSSIDRKGRYAYNNQPNIGQWNLIRLTETLLPLLGDNVLDEDVLTNNDKSDHKNADQSDDSVSDAALAVAQDILNVYAGKYQSYWLAGMRKKLGLQTDKDSDLELIQALLTHMEDGQADFTLTFYYLSQLDEKLNATDESLHNLFATTEAIKQWLEKWRKRLVEDASSNKKRQQLMQSVNPVYIPRNHQIERAIRAAEDHNDFSVFDELQQVLQNPFDIQHDKKSYMLPPLAEEVVHQTFCGT